MLAGTAAVPLTALALQFASKPASFNCVVFILENYEEIQTISLFLLLYVTFELLLFFKAGPWRYK